MPSCSVLGKIFYPLPSQSNFINDMFDMKLALYTPFSSQMSPGIFITSSDDIETFNLVEQLNSSIYFNEKYSDVVLLAHRSTIQIAKDHGCYQIGREIDMGTNGIFNTKISECEYVLQKPSISKIKDTNLVKEANGESFVYTDSVFYFSQTIVRNLHLLSKTCLNQLIKLHIEMDAYRDFLQPLGTNAITLHEFISSLPHACVSNKDRAVIFEQLYELMKNKRTIVIALDNSKFYHLGTLNEIFELYFNESDANSIEFRDKIAFETNGMDGKQLCLINTKFKESRVYFGSSCILEHCVFDLNESTQLNIGANCYLNNCILIKSELNILKLENNLQLPSNIFLHTIPILDNRYVTIFFEMSDNLKKNYKSFAEVKFLNRDGVTLNKFKNNLLKDNSLNEFSLWDLRLYTSKATASESFIEACKFMNYYLKSGEDILTTETIDNKFSLFDLLKLANYERMIQMKEMIGNYKL